MLYVDGEMPATEMQERMRRLVAAHGGAYPDDLKILSMDQQEAHAMLNLASELDQALIEQIDAEVIFLDNRSTLVHGGRENDAEVLGRHAAMASRAEAHRTRPCCLSIMPAAAALRPAAPASARTCSTRSST